MHDHRPKRLSRSLLDAARRLLPWGAPRWIAPAGGVSEIAIDPRDKRVLRGLVEDARQGLIRRHRGFWQQACRDLSPDVALDVGANLGDCLFMPQYPGGSRVFGFEANPKLKPLLEQSRSRHPQRDQITLCFGLVGAEHDGQADFYIDTKNSQTSGAIQNHADPRRYETIASPTLSVDRVLADAGCVPEQLLFNVDVEGFEAHVLAGMSQTLRAAQSAVGFIEFDTRLTTAASADPRDFFTKLQADFQVYGFVGSDRLTDLRDIDFASFETTLREAASRKHGAVGHTDLVLLAGDLRDRHQRLIEAWM